MDVSENSGISPQIIHFNRVFHYKPSILRYPYFWKHPYMVKIHSCEIQTMNMLLRRENEWPQPESESR